MISRIYNDRRGEILPIFTDDDDGSRLGELHVKAVTRGRDIVDRFYSEAIHRKSSKGALAVILSSPGDNPFRAIQDRDTTIKARDPLGS